MAQNLYGLTKLLMGDPEADGGMGLTLAEVFGQTVTGSCQITTTDPTITTIPIEESDDPILSIVAPGSMTLQFSTFNTAPEALLAAFGGTVTGTGDTEVWNAPLQSPEITKSLRLETKNGRYVNLPKVQLNPRLGIVFDKTQPGKIDFTCTILVPDKVGEPKMIVGKIAA